MADAKDSAIEALLRQQSEALQRLVEEAQRIQRDIHQHLHLLRHAGDTAPSQPEKRKRTRQRKA